MAILKDLYKLFCEGSKALAYVKLCQKTGMTPPDIDLWIAVFKNSSRYIDNRAEIYMNNLESKFKTKSLSKPEKTKSGIKETIRNSKTYTKLYNIFRE